MVMKFFKSAVFSVVASLFLVFSLVGCDDVGKVSEAMSISHKEGVADSDGTIKFYLPAGTVALRIEFDSSNERDVNMGRVEKMLTEAGIEGSSSYDYPTSQYVQMKALEKRILVSLPSEVKVVKPYGSTGMPIFEWRYAEGFVIDNRA